MTAEFLERKEHFDVTSATSVVTGLDMLGDDEFDCGSHYDMPQRSGLGLLEAVKEDRPDLPFVLFTGKGSGEVVSDAISVGITDYLQKQPGTEQFDLLANRVSNSVERGSEMVTVGELDDGFYVEDDGLGISPDEREGDLRD